MAREPRGNLLNRQYSSPLLPKGQLGSFRQTPISVSDQSGIGNLSDNSDLQEGDEENSNDDDATQHRKEYSLRKRAPVKYNQVLYNTQVLENGITPVKSSRHKRVVWESLDDGEDEDSDRTPNGKREFPRSHICDSGPDNYEDNTENRIHLRKARRNKTVVLYKRSKNSATNKNINRKPPSLTQRSQIDSSSSNSAENDTTEEETSKIQKPNTKNQKLDNELGKIDLNSFQFKDRFEDVAGLDHHLQALKEMILWPLLYPQVFQYYDISPPSGVLFYGPPGTGKTMVVKALVNEYSSILSEHTSLGKKEVSFYIKSSSDILSKWIGVAEKTLRKLFEEASKNAPSIIFFDELDGLAPARTAKQDQSHISLVSTLLQLMDGIQKKHNVIVIGATNRIDDIDPALRRVGRFDQELKFDLPNYQARMKLFEIQLQKWASKKGHTLHNGVSTLGELQSEPFLKTMGLVTEGFCGADIKGLIREAVMTFIRRSLTVDSCPDKLKEKHFLTSTNDFNPEVNVSPSDFFEALGKIHSTTNRTEDVAFASHLVRVLENFQPEPDTLPFFRILIKRYLSQEDQMMYI